MKITRRWVRRAATISAAAALTIAPAAAANALGLEHDAEGIS
ncbi:hypothetical protein [Mumia sp. ZJ1417]|nr:hypothetical protein [Mumia sp. ZJ1417]